MFSKLHTVGKVSVENFTLFKKKLYCNNVLILDIKKNDNSKLYLNFF